MVVKNDNPISVIKNRNLSRNETAWRKSGSMHLVQLWRGAKLFRFYKRVPRGWVVVHAGFKQGMVTTRANMKRDKHGNMMDATYWFKQYIGLVLTLIALASVGVAGYARELGIGSVNLFLWTGVTVGLLGLLMHELRPFRSRTTMTFDPAAVEARKKEIAEAEASTKAKATKKKN